MPSRLWSRARYATLCFATVLAPALVAAQQAVADGRVRVRERPTKQAKIVATLRAGDTVTFLDHDAPEQTYLHVRLPEGTEGWVSASFAHHLASGSHLRAAGSCGIKCGSERWAVKTLTDDDASEVDFSPVVRTVSQLRKYHAPGDPTDYARSGDVERTTFEVHGKIIAWKMEEDEDLHLVIASPSNSTVTIIAEIPDRTCKRVCSSPKVAEMMAARAAVIAELGEPSHSKYKNVSPARSVILTGVGFFDRIHGQRGVAPNGIELHPVLKVEFR